MNSPPFDLQTAQTNYFNWRPALFNRDVDVGVAVICVMTRFIVAGRCYNARGRLMCL